MCIDYLNTKNEKRRVVNVRRNLAGKSNSKEIKSDGQSIYRNGRTNDEANTHRQRSAALKQTKRGRKETEIRARQISKRTKSKENTEARNSGSKARRTVTRQSDTDYNSNKENRHATDTAVILEAVADLKSGIESKIDEIDRNNKESIRKVEAEIISIRNEFNKRIEGLTKKVEDRVRKVFEKDIEIAVQKATERNKCALEKSVKTNEKNIQRIEQTVISTVKEEIGDEIDVLAERVKAIENSILNDKDKSDSDELRKRRIVVRNLKEREAENVVERVNNVIEYLKVKSVKVISAER